MPPDSSTVLRTQTPRKFGFLFLSLAVLVADQWTKWLIEVHLPLHASTPVLDGFANFTHVRNTGVAFGMFAAQGVASGSWLLTALGLGALIAVCVYFWLTPTKDRVLLAALALVVGGALGNLLDRATTGAVTDFVDLFLGTHHWPAFNVADAAISIGIVLMAIDSLKRRHPPAESA